MDRFHRHGDLEDARNADRHVGSPLDRSRPLQVSDVVGAGRREDRSAPAAPTRIRRSRSERLALSEDDQLRRRDRVVGHTIVGAVAIIVFLAMLLIIGSLVTFVVAMAALFVGLRSLTFAMSIGLDDAWGWTRDGGMSSPLRWSDYIVLGGMRWLRRRSRAAADVQAAGAIRMLPPESPH